MASHVVADILQLTGKYFVRVKYGKGGLINKAWENNKFIKENLEVSTACKHWFDISLEEFKIITLWSMNPAKETLKGLSFQKAPHFTKNLYRVAKWGKSEFFILINGGCAALNLWDFKKITECKRWQLSNNKLTKNWISSEDFLQIMEAKGIKY